MNEDAYTQGEALLAMGEKEAQYVQVHITCPTERRLEIMNNKPDAYISTNEVTYAVLVHLDGRSGLSVASRFSPEIVERALAVARSSVAKEYFYGLPEKKQIHKPEVYDKRIATLDAERQLNLAEELITSMNSTSLSSGSITKEITTHLVFTSEGVQQSEQSTSFSAVAECIARQGEKVSSAWDYQQERELFPLAPLGSALAQKTNHFLHAKPLHEKIKTVILKPEPFTELLDNAFLANLNGKNVEKEKSILTGKIGQLIVSPLVNISDNGLLPLGINSRSVDYEGTPSQETKLISRGVLQSYVYDHNTALHAGKTSTGNAGLGGIECTNVVVDGEYHDVSEALIIDSVIGAHTADDIATDFSVTVDRAYLLKNGEKIPVTGFMISGKMIEALQKAVSLGKKREGRNGIYTGALATTGVNVVV